MAINFYSSISLNKNELQNAVVQNAGSDPGSPVAGQIYYNSGDNTLRFYNGTAFQAVNVTGADITSVQDGNGLTGGADSGDVTLTVGAGTGITVNTNDVAVSAAQTGITSILNTSLVVGRDADNQIKFGTDNQIIFRVGAGDGVTFKASGEIEATKFDGALEGNADTATALATARAINGVDFDGTAAITVTAAAGTLTGSTLNSGVTASSLTSLGTITTGVWNGTAIAHDYIGLDAIDDTNIADSSIKSEHLNKLAITGQTDLGANWASGDSLLLHDTSAGALREGTIGNLQTYMQNNLTFTTNTDNDVNNANLLTALAALESSGGAANENIVIGADSGDTIVITGNLQVSGTTTTVDSTTVTLNDHNIVLDSGNSTSAVVDGAGITLEGGTGDDVTWMWSASNTRLEAKLGASLTRIAASDFYGNFQGNATTATTATTATNVTAVANNSNNETVYLTFVDGATGQQGIETDTALNYNPSSNILTVVELDVSGDVDVDGTLETDALTIGGAAVLAQATTSAVGAVELATSAETQTGTDTTRAVTPDGLAARMVVADIDVSSLTDANIVTITHNLGTADIMVQVYDKTTEANIMCDIARTTDDFATASTSVVSIDFGTAPPNDCRALITSLKGATASGTVAYT